MGIEPTFTVWQTVVLAVILHLHMRSLSALESIPITFVESTPGARLRFTVGGVMEPMEPVDGFEPPTC